MRKIEITADRLVQSLLKLSETRKLSLLDSCGVGRPGADLLIAGFDPVETLEIDKEDPAETLTVFDEKLGSNDLAAVFTMSYDFGVKLQRIGSRSIHAASLEPDIHLALFDCLIVHDYNTAVTYISGNPAKYESVAKILLRSSPSEKADSNPSSWRSIARSNFTRSRYLQAIGEIKELIRSGETYQANLTQQLSVELPAETSPAEIFSRLRRNHPAPFAAFIDRGSSAVISASPELFIQISPGANGGRQVTASPIKGTRRRGRTVAEDELLRAELLGSEKDRAENTMIVDLMRNDLGRICTYGSLAVESLCNLEVHPSLFHLVSTVAGTLHDHTAFSDVIRAIFPCGSITGAPKIRTMLIIDEIESRLRGLSMGAIGCRIPGEAFALQDTFEMSVAIRTMVIRDGTAVFNVGGGIVIDSDPESELDESMLKAKALLDALGVIGFGL